MSKELDALYEGVIEKLASMNRPAPAPVMQKTAQEKELDNFYQAVLVKLASEGESEEEEKEEEKKEEKCEDKEEKSFPWQEKESRQKVASNNDIDNFYRGVMGILANRR